VILNWVNMQLYQFEKHDGNGNSVHKKLSHLRHRVFCAFPRHWTMASCLMNGGEKSCARTSAVNYTIGADFEIRIQKQFGLNLAML